MKNTPTQELMKWIASCSLEEIHTIAAKTGLSEGGLRKLKYGERTNPTGSTIDLLNAYREKQ